MIQFANTLRLISAALNGVLMAELLLFGVEAFRPLREHGVARRMPLHYAGAFVVLIAYIAFNTFSTLHHYDQHIHWEAPSYIFTALVGIVSVYVARRNLRKESLPVTGMAVTGSVVPDVLKEHQR